MRGVNWDLFRLFSSVAELGSVNRAAKALGISQPTLSRRLQELERLVGAPLFFRATSGVQLTAEGEDLRRSATAMLNAFEGFQRDVQSTIEKRSSVVRISTTEGLTKHWLFPRIRHLSERYPDIQLELSSTSTRESLVKRDLDFVIRIGAPEDGELTGKRVGSISFGIFGSEQYIAERSNPRTIADLTDHNIIGTGRYTRDSRTRENDLFYKFAELARLKSSIRVSPPANLYAAATEGLGLACLAVPFARAEGLVQVLPTETATLGVWLLRRRECDLRKLTRGVRHFLEMEFSRSRGWLSGKELKPPSRPRERGVITAETGATFL